MSSSQVNKTVICKYCGTHEVVKCGSYKGTPRYLCKLCRRKFKDDDCVFYMNVPVAHIEYVLNLYYRGTRINDIRNNMQRLFGYYPSASLIRFWVDKYTARAERIMKDHCHPHVGDTWIVDELKIKMSGKIIWIYAIIDEKTEFLLTWSINRTFTTDIVNTLIKRASEVACRIPKVVMMCAPNSSFKTIEEGSSYVSIHIPREMFTIRNRIGVLSNITSTNLHRIENIASCRTLNTAIKYFMGLSIHYNYFESNERLNGKTPAEATQIDYPFHSWKDIITKS